MARGHEAFQNFKSGKYVHLDDLKHLTNHIFRNLNGDYTPNYKFGIICLRIRVKLLLCADGDNRKVSNLWPNGVRKFVKTIW